MRKVIFNLVIIVLVFTSCVSTNNNSIEGEVWSIVNGQEKIDYKISLNTNLNDYLSSEYFGLIDFTFENKSNNWITIKDLKISSGFPEADSNLKLIIGEDLNIWFESTLKQKEIEERNKTNVRLAMVGLGLLMQVAHDDYVKAGGWALMTGAVVSQGISNYNMNNGFNTGVQLPEKHLLNSDIKIPPGLSVSRWILLNTDNVSTKIFIRNLLLNFKDDKGNNYKAKCYLRTFDDKTKWQSLLRATGQFYTN